MIDWGMDESGVPDKKMPVISAILGQTSKVANLNFRWSAELERYGVDYFHAKDHWNKKARCYRGISNKKREALLSSLVSQISKYARLKV
jgi:hypothetical protein